MLKDDLEHLHQTSKRISDLNSRMKNKMQKVYEEEKRKAIGPVVRLIEFLRYQTYRVYNKSYKTIFNRLPDNAATDTWKKIYTWPHNRIQAFYDFLRLKFLGIE